MPTSEAKVWAQGELTLEEKPQTGEKDYITGTLKMNTGVKLEVKGHRVPANDGNLEEFTFRGTGQVKIAADKTLNLDYAIRGSLSPHGPPADKAVAVKGYLQALGADRWAPRYSIGAFVLTRSNGNSAGGTGQ
jgi:hypothetical protein